MVFKHVFSHEQITKDFLNFYLEYIGSDLSIQNDNIKLHDYYLDIMVVLSNNEMINLEMYNNFSEVECKKSLSYASMLYSHQLRKRNLIVKLRK